LNSWSPIAQLRCPSVSVTTNGGAPTNRAGNRSSKSRTGSTRWSFTDTSCRSWSSAVICYFSVWPSDPGSVFAVTALGTLRFHDVLWITAVGPKNPERGRPRIHGWPNAWGACPIPVAGIVAPPLTYQRCRFRLGACPNASRRTRFSRMTRALLNTIITCIAKSYRSGGA
jgi:hypothetical protein